jgi:hypothetical protein
MGWYGLISSHSGQGQKVGSFEHVNEQCHIMRGNVWVRNRLLVSHEGPSTMENVSKYVMKDTIQAEDYGFIHYGKIWSVTGVTICSNLRFK